MSDKNIAYLSNENMSDLRGSLKYHYRGNRGDWMLTRDAVHGELLKAIRAIDVMRGVAVAALKHSPPRTQAESLQRQREIEKQKERSEHIADELSKRRLTQTNTTRSGNQFLYQNEESSNVLHRTGSGSPSPPSASSNNNKNNHRSGSRSQSNGNHRQSYAQQLPQKNHSPLPSAGSTVPRNAFPTAHHHQNDFSSSSSPPASLSSSLRQQQQQQQKPPVAPRISISPPQQENARNQKSPSSYHQQQHEIHLQHISTARTTSQDALMDVDPQLAFEAIAVSRGQLGEALHILRGDPIDLGDDSDASGNPPMKVIARSPPQTFYRHNDPDSKKKNSNNNNNNNTSTKQ